MICCVLIACKKTEVNFNYSPANPRAGQTVQFSNLSSSGEEWSWAFGDGATSTTKSPAHIFKQPGTYRVVLKVDNNNSWVATKEITVFDTIPSFSISDTTFSIYQDYTLSVLVYNPYNYAAEYVWLLGDGVEVSEKDPKLNTDKLTVYFTEPNDSAEIRLQVTLNGVMTEIRKSYFIADKATNSLLLRTNEGDYRQRIFGTRSEPAVADESAKEMLDAENDTKQAYNGHEFTLAEVSEVFPGVEGFRIANRKIYYRADGLWVAHIGGTDRVQIDSRPCTYMTLDTHDNRIYWANAEGVWYMPFVGSDNNKFVTTPTLLNEWTNVTKIAADGDPK